MSESRRAVAYIRVSDVSQVQGHSLTAQERLFYELCKNRNWLPIKVYREEGKSAHVDAIARRPVFKQLLDDAAVHRFDVVVVHTMDRWARNLKVTLESLAILSKYNVGLVSITESVDYTTPEGMLFLHMLGAFSQFFSSSLAKHVRKGQQQRAHEGKHTGFLPFGYESCWEKSEKGNKTQRCDPEHSGGVHIHPNEGPMVAELFKRYSCGDTSLGQLATWLNNSGFRTRNMHSLRNAGGEMVTGPRLFTTASIRGLLHNPFFMGKVIYQKQLLPGAHEGLVSEELFEVVQRALKKNRGRSESITGSNREYLLKGIIHCAYCGMPMWAHTNKNGHSYYREHRCSRSGTSCPTGGSCIPCHLADDQVKALVSGIELQPRWLEEVLTIISLKDEVDRIKQEREDTASRLRRVGRAYIDGLLAEEEYTRQKRLLETSLESLVVPDFNAAEDAGKLIMDLPRLWASATPSEQRTLLMTMLDAVYVDAKASRSIVAIKPKPPFRPIFQVAATRNGSTVRIIKEPLDTLPSGSPMFLVETGESRTPRPKETARNMLQV